MGELYEPFPKLPKNIRQIGERDKVLKLYLEDYVNTYLKRLQPVKGADLRVGLLLGSRETHEDTPYVFVDGALEMDSVTEEGERVVFTEEAWKKAYQDVEQMFPQKTVQGWFLCAGPGCTLSPLAYWKQHSQYFAGKNQLMYLNCGLEGDDAVYLASSDGFYKLRGYSIYYERNQMMQDYMISRRDMQRSENGADDKVIRDFRQKMEERREENGHRRNTVGILTGLCGILTVTVLAGGVTMFNSYKKMRHMESVIASVDPKDAIRGGLLAFAGDRQVEDPSGKGWGWDDEPDYIIEEVSGKVAPTKENGGQQEREQPQEINRETLSESLGGVFSREEEKGGLPATGARRDEMGETDRSEAETKWESKLEGPPKAETGEKPEGSSKAEADEKPEGSSKAESGEKPEGSSKAEADEKSEETSKAGAGEKEKVDPGQEDKPASGSSYRTYTVAGGETLYGICFKLYHNLNHIDEICRINALSNEDSIFQGQKLLVP